MNPAWMRRALDLARSGDGFVQPNPMVGCVIVRDGRIVGEGYHRRFGGPHAEVEALREATRRGNSGAIAGSDVYVTLEPCAHHGKTPPCADALVDAGVGRVFVAAADPFADVDGRGIGRLRDAGIDVHVGIERDAATELNAPFFKRVRTGRPWVIAKWAMTIDGRIATVAGHSRWITGAESRRDVHHRRSRVDAVVVGMGTVAADDPELTARDVDADPPRIATRVVLCRSRLPSVDSRLVRTVAAAPLLIVAPEPLAASADADALRDRGVQFHAADDSVGGLMAAASDRDWTSVVVEGGAGVLGSIVAAGHVDEVQVYIGPKIFGGASAPGPVGGVGLSDVESSPAMRRIATQTFGDDVKVTYRRRLDDFS